MNGDAKLGKLLCDGDIITKKQLNNALQAQVVGDNRALGEILVGKGYCTLDEITDVILGTHHEPVQEKEPDEPKELSEKQILNTKFTLSVQTMIGATTGIASLVGMWYMLQADIQEARELPDIRSLYSEEYPSKPEGYNWSPSYEQYKQQVGNLQNDVDDLYEMIETFEEELKKFGEQMTELRIKLGK
jgi:SMC interacting uncharacterized protein involved in chromosome segregation|tara:strand:- start:627 stop:1190 length:564 start_codon:yes stop_codon:yes gene_type:complete